MWSICADFSGRALEKKIDIAKVSQGTIERDILWQIFSSFLNFFNDIGEVLKIDPASN